jgi:DNA-binding NtrC family response regulator
MTRREEHPPDPRGEGIVARPLIHKREATILLVEDDEAIRNALTRILVKEGYLVLTAESGKAAWQILCAPLTPIHVVLLDVQVPDMSGTVLCARILEMYPDIAVVVYT